MAKIGLRLKNLRLRRQLTIRLLSVRSGVSHSTISLIERDKVSPSIDTLNAILDAMGSTLVGFLSEMSAVGHSPFYRADSLPEIGNDGGISYKIIGINYPNRQLQILKETYAAGADTGDLLHHEAQEGGIVLTGKIEITVGDKQQILQAGDGYYFDSREGHRFRNVGEGTAEIISAITPPNY